MPSLNGLGAILLYTEVDTMEKSVKIFEYVIGMWLSVLLLIELHKFATTDNLASGVWAILLLVAVTNIRNNVAKDGDKE